VLRQSALVFEPVSRNSAIRLWVRESGVNVRKRQKTKTTPTKVRASLSPGTASPRTGTVCSDMDPKTGRDIRNTHDIWSQVSKRYFETFVFEDLKAATGGGKALSFVLLEAL
jgi:hypothetical protein